MLKGKTINLVKESKLVLSHCSTALNFANLFINLLFLLYVLI